MRAEFPIYVQYLRFRIPTCVRWIQGYEFTVSVGGGTLVFLCVAVAPHWQVQATYYGGDAAQPEPRGPQVRLTSRDCN